MQSNGSSGNKPHIRRPALTVAGGGGVAEILGTLSSRQSTNSMSDMQEIFNAHLDRATGTKKKHATIQSPTTTTTAAATGPSSSGNNNNAVSPTGGSGTAISIATGLLNDPMTRLGNKSKSSPAAGGKAKDRRANLCADDAQTSLNRSTVGRYCSVCKMVDPMVKQSFIDHIMGKKHRIASFKQKLTKKQKEERDAKTLHVTGYDARMMPEEICGIFWELGMSDIAYTKKHVFIEFNTKQQAMTTLSTKVFTTSGRRLNTQHRTPRNHISDRMAEEPVAFFMSPVIKNLIDMKASSEKELQETLDRLINDIQLRPEEYENRQYVRDRIEHFLRLEFPNVVCHVFGSSGNNLGFHGADVDLYAALGYDPYDTPRAADGESAAAKLTYYLAKHLRRQHWITGVEAIPKARVPIIKFQQAGVAVDLSFRNGMPIQNTALIRLFTYVHPLVRPYMLLVRFWAKMQRLAGGGKPDTLLTNYALTMLMAFAIMQGRQVLPSLADLRNTSYRKVIVNGWNCGFGENTTTFANKKHDCSAFQLALEFFQYYATLDVSLWVLCPLTGELISRQDMASKSHGKLSKDFADYISAPGNLQVETPICVQDAFDLSHNVTRGLKMIPLERFKILCKKSAQILQRVMSFQLPLAKLFQPIELTDDMYDEGDQVAGGGSGGDGNGVQDADADDVTMVDEVIVIGDDPDTSQDIQVLEEVKMVINNHEERKKEV